MKNLLVTFLTLGMLGGVASADHFRGGRGGGGGWGHSGGGVRVTGGGGWHGGGGTTWRGGGGTTWRGGNAGWSGGVRVTSSPRVYSPRVYNNYNSYRVVRRPIYVQRPVMRYRYYNYYQRPAVFVENYPPRDGYYWVAGQWTWSGYEWMWTPGHYEPDPNWVQPGYGYDYNYNNGNTSVSVSSPGYDYEYQNGY